MNVSQRLNGIGEYYFSAKLREIEHLNRQGRQVINLGIGSPDLPPHPDVIATLHEASARCDTHAYQGYRGVPALRCAISEWYMKWFGVSLDPESEVLPLIGSKEGIMHICMTYLNPGDGALVPNPGYPTYSSAVQLAGGRAIPYELNEANDWFPDFEALENMAARDKKIKLLFVNYPHMPTGQLPNATLFEKIIAFAKKNDILVCHDNPYSFILNDTPSSMLSLAGAKEVVMELNSLSKSHNMAGWRVGMLCAGADKIDAVIRFKSNMDSGMFLPVQLAAAAALNLGQQWFKDLNSVYHDRRKKIFEMLDLLGCTFSTSQAGLFVWGRVPAEYASGYALSDELLSQAAVFITPGGIFGSAGDNFIRASLCCSVDKLEMSLDRIKAFIASKAKQDV